MEGPGQLSATGWCSMQDVQHVTLGQGTPAVRSGRSGAATVTGAATPPCLTPLHRLATTRRVIVLWTIFYGLSSWLIEFGFAQLDPRAKHSFGFGLSRVVYAVCWGVAAWVAVRMTDRWPITSYRQYGRIALHLAVCMIVVIAWGTAAYEINVAIVPGWKPQGLALMLASTAKNVIFGYGVLVVLMHVVWWVRRHRHGEFAALERAQASATAELEAAERARHAAEAQRQAAEAELRALKLELQPHFLFNALHIVSATIPRDPVAANEALVQISDYLHDVVRTSRVHRVCLRDELRALGRYLDIERLRFEERLNVRFDVPEALYDVEVPHLLLQPLVENAIKHAIEPRAAPGHLVVAGRALQDAHGYEALELTVRDDGPGPSARAARQGTGKGLQITTARLAEMYGDAAELRLTAADGGGALARIVIPLHRLVDGATAQPASDRLRDGAGRRSASDADGRGPRREAPSTARAPEPCSTGEHRRSERTTAGEATA